MKLRHYRSGCYVDVEIDIFEYKDEILGVLSDKELEDELKRRKEEKDNVTKSRTSYFINSEIDISDYYEEALEWAGDGSLISELESRGMYVYDKSEIPQFDGDIKKMAIFLGLREWSTKEQILKEIDYFIKDGK